MRFVAAPVIARQNAAAGLLLADRELTRPPTHLTIIGPKQNGDAARLFETALQYASGYKRVEWWDAREGALPNADVEYPARKEASTYICTGNSCSSPISSPEEIRPKIERLKTRK